VQAGTGGAGSLLTINGSGFGSTQGTVQLRDANTGGAQYLELDSYDIQSWTNTEIRVRVPGNVVKGAGSTPTNPIRGTCGSGRIKVNTASGTFAESGAGSELDVEFALSQRLYTSGGSGPIVNKAKFLLVKNNCADGFTFRIDNTLRNDVNAIRVIEAALATWSVRLGVYLALERDAQGALVSQAVLSSQADGINSLHYDVLGGSTLMRTSSNDFFDCGSGTTLRTATKDVDIAINAGSTWDFSLKGNVQGLSFLSAFLHELGHALGVAHAVTPSTAANQQRELMYFQMSSNSVAADRQSLTSGRGKTVVAGVDIVAQRQLQTWCNPDTQTLGTSGSTACRATRPLAPGLQAQANPGVSRTITLTWNAIYNATGYTIQSSLDPIAGFTDYAPIFNGSITSHTTGILDPVTDYYFRIKATNVAGSSPYSNVATETTAARMTQAPLAPPTALQGTVVNGSPISNYLSWSYSTTGATFMITRATSIEFENVVQFMTGVDARDYVDTNITPGTVYYYRVYAQLFGDESDDTPPVSLTAAGCTPLGLVPAIISIGQANSNLKSYFLNGSVSGATSYTWNINPPVEDAGGWVVLGQSSSGITIDYAGAFPYSGPVATVVVDITDNCGNITSRSIGLGTPAGYVLERPGAQRGGSKVDGSANTVTIHPNPAQKQLYFTMSAQWSDSQIRLLDLKSGSTLRQWKAKTSGFEANLSGIPAGIYLIEVTSKNQVKRLRLEVAP